MTSSPAAPSAAAIAAGLGRRFGAPNATSTRLPATPPIATAIGELGHTGAAGGGHDRRRARRSMRRRRAARCATATACRPSRRRRPRRRRAASGTSSRSTRRRRRSHPGSPEPGRGADRRRRTARLRRRPLRRRSRPTPATVGRPARTSTAAGTATQPSWTTAEQELPSRVRDVVAAWPRSALTPLLVADGEIDEEHQGERDDASTRRAGRRRRGGGSSARPASGRSCSTASPSAG